jgi:ADP-heptose:LPS heptosyltransferase
LGDLAKPSQDCAPTLLVTELWGLGDLALAVPFMRAASLTARVTLLAKPHAADLIARFAPGVEHVPFTAPWTPFRGKYRLLGWPWRSMAGIARTLRKRHFDAGVTARPDPRDHAVLAACGASLRYGFPHAGSGLLLNRPLRPPASPHRADHWAALALALGIQIEAPRAAPRNGRKIIIHAGAGQPTRLWPRERYDALALTLGRAGWEPEILDDSFVGVGRLIDALDSADRFIGNDSGPGHIAALLGVPTFTLFGPQIPAAFAPRHPRSRWIEGAPCPYKPCSDYCRFEEARCLTSIEAASATDQITQWLSA